MLRFRYTLVSLIDIPDDALSRHPPLQAALLVLKYALVDADPAVTLERLLAVAAALDLTLIAIVIRYLSKERDWLDQAQLRRVLSRLLSGQEEKIMSLLEKEIIDEARPGIVADTLLRLLE